LIELQLRETLDSQTRVVKELNDLRVERALMLQFINDENEKARKLTSALTRQKEDVKKTVAAMEADKASLESILRSHRDEKKRFEEDRERERTERAIAHRLFESRRTDAAEKEVSEVRRAAEEAQRERERLHADLLQLKRHVTCPLHSQLTTQIAELAAKRDEAMAALEASDKQLRAAQGLSVLSITSRRQKLSVRSRRTTFANGRKRTK
jgi:predicted RNase H-like nuclease (RuvC/YqgF family)